MGVPRPIRITEQFAEDTLDRKGRQSVISLSVMGVLLATMVGCGYSGSTGHQSRPSLSPPNENMPRTLPNSLSLDPPTDSVWLPDFDLGGIVGRGQD